MNQHTVGGLSLAGITRHSIAVIEMRMLARIEFDRAASIHLKTQPPVVVLADALHRAQLSVRQLQPARGRGKLHAVSDGKHPFLVTID